MGKVIGKLTVYFEDPFWVGIFECIEDEKLSVCKVTFGVEPKDYEIQEFIIKNYYSLQFSPAVTTVVKETKKNPKKMQREAKKQKKTNNSSRGAVFHQSKTVSIIPLSRIPATIHQKTF